MIRIGSRKSELARIQAYAVGARLEALGQKVEYFFKESLGDKNLSDPLWKMPEKGVFTEDFTQDLIEERVDLVVHSWKDLPTEARAETAIVATLEREDLRDLLVIPAANFKHFRADASFTVLSSSPRREYNLKASLREYLPFAFNDLVFAPVRGNVPTRFRKLFEGEGQALVVAAAAVKRLLSAPEPEFAETKTQLRKWIGTAKIIFLPLSFNPTAAAQGALALEIKKSNSTLRELLARLNSQEDFDNIQQERAILKGYGGGCHQKIGVSLQKLGEKRVLSLKGQRDTGEVLHQYGFLAEGQKASRPKIPAKVAWPLPGDDNQFFERKRLEVEEPQSLEKHILLLTKAEALPADWRLGPAQTVWTSGLDTWKKLSKLGIFVNGSFESLGEHSDTTAEQILNHARWLKLTHKSGVLNKFESLATYELIPKQNVPDLSAKTHFYWMSSSLFLEAVQRFPIVETGYHFLPPGHSAEIIIEYLQKKSENPRYEIVFSYQDWLKDYVEMPS